MRKPLKKGLFLFHGVFLLPNNDIYNTGSKKIKLYFMKNSFKKNALNSVKLPFCMS